MKLFIKQLIGTTLLLLMLSFNVAASNSNSLYMPQVKGAKGSEIVLPFYMTNTSEITAIQFTIEVPSGFSINTNVATLTDRKSDHVIVAKADTDNKYKVMAYSPSNATFLGQSGKILSIGLIIPDTAVEGNTYSTTLSDVVLCIADGNNVVTEYNTGDITIAQCPDLVVSDITTDKATYNPGEMLTVSWTVSNIGDLPTNSGWKEQLYFVNNDTEKLIATTYYDQALASNGTSSRNTTIQLPSTLGLDGEMSLRINVVPNSDSGEGPEAQNNNSSEKSDLYLGKILYLEIPNFSIAENSNAPIRCKLTRSGNTTDDETFTITNADVTRISVPESVSIPTGQSSVVFYATIINNQVLDATSSIEIAASNESYEKVSSVINIEDDETATLNLKLSKDSISEGESFLLTITTNRVTSTPVELSLTSDQNKHFNIPSPIIIPAGDSSTTVEITTVDDDIPHLIVDAELSATAANHDTGYTYIKVEDNDIPQIELTLTPNKVSEADGVTSIMATLRRTVVTNNKVTIKLTDDSNGGLFYSSSTIVLEKGVTEAKFSIGAIDNTIVDGERDITVTAAVYLSSCNCSTAGTSAGEVSKKITILDNDGPTLKVTSSKSTAKEGDEIILKVSRNTSTAESLNVNLSSDADEALSYMSDITIPAGASYVEVAVSVLSNELSGDSKTTVFTVSADGYSDGTCWILLSDQTLPDASITDLSTGKTEAEVGSNITLNLTVNNLGATPLPDATPIAIFIDNATSPTATIYTQEAISAGSTLNMSTSITLPTTVGSHTIKAEVNYGQKTTELIYTNNYSSLSIKTIPNFTATASVEKNIYNQGESITISGTATGNSAANATIELYIINDGTRQTIEAKADESGHFTAIYTPYEYQMGHFTIGACYPGENLKTEQASFDIYGIKRSPSSYITCETILNEPYSGNISIINPGVLDITNVNVEILEKPDNFNVEFTAISEIIGGASASLQYTLIGTEASSGDDWQQVKAKVTTNQGASLDLILYCYCRVATGKLQSETSNIKTTMTRGATREYPITITNVGKGATGKINVALPDVAWMKSATPIELNSLEQNESATIVLSLTPTDDMQLNVPQTGTIGINCENGDGIPIRYSIEPVSESTGTLVVDVCDEYTYYTTEAPHVAGAGVIVKHPTSGAIVAQGTTDENGLFTVTLPEGYYTLNVTSDNHNSYQNNILVDPGTNNKFIINLSFEAISVNWKVEETEVEDKYEIITTVEYETNVPVPVVELSMPSSIPAKELGEGESLIFYAILTNKGLITAKDVEFLLPEGFNVLKFEALSHNEPFNLAPQESIIIPVKVTHTVTSAQISKLRVKPIDNDPCVGQPGTLYYWDCGKDRKWHRYGIALQVGSCDSNDPSTWDNSGNGNYGGSGSGSWWGGPGSVGSIGSGGYYGSSSNKSNVSTHEDEGCEPCQNKLLYQMSKCVVNHVPIISDVWDIIGWVTDPMGSAIDKGKNMLEDATEKLVPVYGWVRKVVGYKKIYDDCIKPFFEPCDLEGSDTSTKNLLAINKSSSDYPSYIKEYQSNFGILINASDSEIGMMIEFFGDEKWLNSDPDELYKFISTFKQYTNNETTLDIVTRAKPSAISNDMLSTFLERWNNTINESENINKIDFNKVQEYQELINLANTHVKEQGFESIKEYFNHINNVFQEKLDESQSSVCASITLQFSQSMVMTRQAFRGTLTVFNGNETTAMTDVKLSLEVRNSNGVLATSHEFQITPETLDTFSGELSLNSGWSLEANKTGVATILFIPTKYAAPEQSENYTFGGTLSYIDPFTGLEVTRDLYPVTLTVKPSPNLDLTYFMQRDILGDDALTADVVEPSIPAEFSILINNVGYGDASNVRFQTNQPKIIDNEKGLDITFELLSSQLNGGEHTLALGGSVPTDFGTIPAHGTSYAQWWIKSSLLGHFTDYNVEATHITSYDNPDLSLLNNVTIHELIRSLEVINSVNNTKLVGFLANDNIDAEDQPDIIYFSDGTTENVHISTSSSISKISDTEYALTVTPSSSGWNYNSILDPTIGRQELVGVKRNSDGKEISLRNFWQTDRTLRDGKDPLYENRIHFADNMSNGQESYTLTFSDKANETLEITEFGNIPASGTAATTPVTVISVKFNKPIKAETFSTDDIDLSIQGEKMDASKITLSSNDNQTFTLNVTAVTEANGFYVLTIRTAEIVDSEGFAGKNGKSASWVQYVGNKVAIAVKAIPKNGGTITPNSGAFEYGNSTQFTAEASEGFKFLNWTSDDEVLSTEHILDYMVNGDATLTANFETIKHQVTINYDSEGGSIEGGYNAFFDYGKVLNLVATPNNGYNFDGWIVNDMPISSENNLNLTVDKDFVIEAVFTKKILFETTYSFAKGWNWFSINVVNEDLANPTQLFNTISNNIESIVGCEGTLNNGENGFSGSLNTLNNEQSYRIKMTNSDNLTLTGEQCEPTITLSTGWNWLGYASIETQELNTALANIPAESGEIIKGKDEFAIYDGTKWLGNLSSMIPGAGYMYNARSVKSFKYANDNGISTATDNGAVNSISYDKHAYANNMNIIAKLQNSYNETIDASNYIVAAFINDECRGASALCDEWLFMTVHGETNGDEISFRAYDTANGLEYIITEKIEFASDNLSGELSSPTIFTLGNEISNINNIDNDKVSIYPNPVKEHLYIKTGYDSVNLKIVDMSGNCIISKEDVTSEQAVDVSTLTPGVYILTISKDNNTHLHKFIKIE